VRGEVRADVAAGTAGDVRLAADGVDVTLDGTLYRFTVPPPPSAVANAGGALHGNGSVTAPMPGKVVGVAVRAGAQVALHDVVVVLEAMKMEHRIEAPLAGTVEAVHIAVGDVVASGAPLVTIGAAPVAQESAHA
jgi:3-methylcrotonyl-CoA carboxylase alpha subunit